MTDREEAARWVWSIFNIFLVPLIFAIFSDMGWGGVCMFGLFLAYFLVSLKRRFYLFHYLLMEEVWERFWLYDVLGTCI